MNPISCAQGAMERRLWRCAVMAAAVVGAAGCRHAEPQAFHKGAPRIEMAVAEKKSDLAVTPVSTTTAKAPAKRFNYTPRPYPVDERGFSPVDQKLAKAFAREEMIADDAEGALNPY